MLTCKLLVTFLLTCSLWSASAAPVELRTWAWLPGSPVGDSFARYIEDFHSTHSDIRISVEKGSKEQELVVAFAAGVAPDLVQGLGPWATALGPRGMLLPLDAYIDGPNGFRRDEFVDDLWSFSEVRGKTYQLAADGNERALFVATEVADGCGIDTSGPLRDWNDLLGWARKMTLRTSDGVERWGFDMYQENGGNRWHWIWLNEGEILAQDRSRAMLDHPNTIEALEFASDMVNVFGVSPRPGALKGSSQGNFTNGLYGMMISQGIFITKLQQAGKDFVTIPGPPGPGKRGYRFSGATSSTMSIVSSTKHADEAWQFIRFLMYENGVQFADDRGGIPYLKKGLRSARFMKQPWQALAESILTFGSRNNYAAGVSESDWLPQFQAAWNSALGGEAGAEWVLKQAQESINARLAELAGK